MLSLHGNNVCMHRIFTLLINETGGTLVLKRQKSHPDGADDGGHQVLRRPVLVRFIRLPEDPYVESACMRKVSLRLDVQYNGWIWERHITQAQAQAAEQSNGEGKYVQWGAGRARPDIDNSK